MLLDIEHFNKLQSIIDVVSSAGGEHVTVAGGAVRDSVLEKPVADIDVFYQGELNTETLEKAFGGKQKLEKAFPPCPVIDWTLPPGSPLLKAQVEAEEDWIEKYGNYDNAFSVDNYTGDLFNFNGMKVQLIKVECVDTHIAEFPCFLSRMLFSEGHLVIPIEALQDASLKIVRFTDDCSEGYKAKIEAKYEDYL